MITTTAKGSGPALLDKLVIGDPSATLRQWHAAGYRHLLRTTGPRITVGTLDYEWRILAAGILFKRVWPVADFAALDGVRQRWFPVVARLKVYSRMSSLGTSAATARFSRAELGEWIGFFELAPDAWDSETVLARRVISIRDRPDPGGLRRPR